MFNKKPDIFHACWRFDFLAVTRAEFQNLRSKNCENMPDIAMRGIASSTEGKIGNRVFLVLSVTPLLPVHLVVHLVLLQCLGVAWASWLIILRRTQHTSPHIHSSMQDDDRRVRASPSQLRGVRQLPILSRPFARKKGWVHC